MPQALVIGLDSAYNQMVVAALESFSVRAINTTTVDVFLDLNCPKRFQLVSLEIDALHPESSDNIKLLRTHFGEGPATRIVVSSRTIPSTLPMLAEQLGADMYMTKPQQPEGMAAVINAELQKQLDSHEPKLEIKAGRKE